jgi:hypothetical protein
MLINSVGVDHLCWRILYHVDRYVECWVVRCENVFAGRRGHLSERVSYKNGSFRPIVLVWMFLVFRSLISWLYPWCLFMGFLILFLLFMVFCCSELWSDCVALSCVNASLLISCVVLRKAHRVCFVFLVLLFLIVEVWTVSVVITTWAARTVRTARTARLGVGAITRV